MAEFIEERKNKDSITYRVKVPYYVNGVRKFCCASFSSKKYGSKKLALECAKEYRDKMRIQLASVDYVVSIDKTLDEVFKMRETAYGQAAQTNRRFQSIYNKFILPKVGGGTNFKKITHLDIADTLNSVKHEASDDTIARIYSLWKQLYHVAIMNDIVSVDQTQKVIKPKSTMVTKKRDVNTSLSEIEHICEILMVKCKDKRTAALVCLSFYIQYYTGIRPAECYALAKSNIDRMNRIIHIRQSVALDENRKGFISVTKTKESIRDIPYTIELEPYLEDLYELSMGDLLFTKTNGEIITSKHVFNVLKGKHNTNFKPYNIRHQFSTDLVLGGVDIRTVQELMGHAKPTMTLEYARSNNEEKLHALENRVPVPKSVPKN